ncbi:MAG: hypothetical protein ABIS01_11705 [Ferruginibacter sp.]
MALLSETIMIQYFKDGFGIYLPISFINTTTSVGIVNRVSIELIKLGTSKVKYLIRWNNFRKYNNATNKWEFEDLCYHLPVDGKKGITKMIWFDWFLNSVDIWEEGKYSIKAIIWTNGYSKITYSKNYNFTLTEKHASILQQRKKEEDSKLLEVGIENFMEKNILSH